MPEIFPGRWSADIEGDFVVFLIGMRVNRPLEAAQTCRVHARDDAEAAEGARRRPLARLPRKLAGPALADRADRDPVLALVRGARGLRRSAAHQQMWKRFFELVGGTATSASGTRPSGSGPASTRASTAGCRASAWRPPPVTARSARPHVHGSASARTRESPRAGPGRPALRPSPRSSPQAETSGSG